MRFPAVTATLACMALVGTLVTSEQKSRANAGPSSTPAIIVAEPHGLRGVRIVQETLSIDLRPTATGEPVEVEASYQLHNAGPSRRLELLFAFGSVQHSAHEILYDEQPVQGQVAKEEMPTAWLPPRVTPGLPGLKGGEDLRFGPAWRSVHPLAFSIDLRPGSSCLKVRYREDPQVTYARPSMYRQFAYILAPARSWDGFGKLDVTVRVPQAWSVACSPPMPRQGEVLQATFTEIPSDALTLTLRPPIPAGYASVRNAGWVGLALAALLGLAGCWWCGGAARNTAPRGEDTSRRRGGLGMAVLRSLGLGLLLGSLVFAAGSFAVWGADWLFPPPGSEQALIDKLRLSDGYATLAALAMLLAGSLLGVALGTATSLAAFLTARRATASPAEIALESEVAT